MAAGPDCQAPTLQCEDVSKHVGKKFRKAATLPGVRPKFLTPAPEQNGHTGWCHGAPKRGYAWPYGFANRTGAEAVTAAGFKDCNQAGLHSALECVPPAGSRHHGLRNMNEESMSV